MSKRITAVASFVALLAPAPALADSRDASGEAHEYMREYARCMVTGYHRDAVSLVTSPIDASEFKKRFPDLVGHDIVAVPRCKRLVIRQGLKINFDGEPLRFALAEALIERHWKTADPASLAAAPPLSAFVVEPKVAFEARLATIPGGTRKANLRAGYDRSVAMAWLFQFGECVVRADPATARNWTLSTPGSIDETSARRRLGPALGSCLAEGEMLKFNNEVLRGTVAVSYVRLAASTATANSAGAS